MAVSVKAFVLWDVTACTAVCIYIIYIYICIYIYIYIERERERERVELVYNAMKGNILCCYKRFFVNKY